MDKTIAIIECGDVCFDWFEWNEYKINLDDYIAFRIDYRGKYSWHLIGEYRQNDELKTKELSKCQISFTSLVDFMILCKEKNKPIREFFNTHGYIGFDEEVYKLLKAVQEKLIKNEVE